MNLVPGRECGTCTICCTLEAIDDSELQKPSGTMCKNCTGSDCGIHPMRPVACREFFCGWRIMDGLGDNWRPDLSGVYITSKNDGMPPAYQGREGVAVWLARPDVIHRDGFADLLAAWIEKGLPVFLAIPGPPGHYPNSVFLNDELMQPVAEMDRRGVTAKLEQAIGAAVRKGFMAMPTQAFVG
jgi:hypothetical protein